MARGMNNYSMREEIQEFWEKNDEGGRKEEEKNLLCSLLASAPLTRQIPGGHEL